MEVLGPYYTYKSTLWYPLLGGGFTQGISVWGLGVPLVVISCTTQREQRAEVRLGDPQGDMSGV